MKLNIINKKFLILLFGAFLAAAVFVLIPERMVFASDCNSFYCGDGVCDSVCGETNSSCLLDCQATSFCDTTYCGDGTCDSNCNENHSNCSLDCKVSNSCSSFYCGDGVCDSNCGENSYSCQLDCGPAPAKCTNTCSPVNKKECAGVNSFRTCGDYNLDGCNEWSSPQYCSYDQTCQNGTCITNIINQCSRHASLKCYDNDIYWYDSCGNQQEKYQECSSDFFTSDFRCFGNVAQREKISQGCANSACYSNIVWENFQECSALGKVCQNGSCASQTIINNPTVDLDANSSDGPITISYNTSATLSWTSTNSNSCQASGAWSGSRNTSGSESTGNLTSSRTYTLTCTGQGGTVSDSVTVNVASQQNQNTSPVADAGPNKSVIENNSVILEGSGYDPDGDNVSFSWYCNGGNLSNSNTNRPTFFAPSVYQDTNYTCTLTVTDSHGLSNSDQMNVFIDDIDQQQNISVSLFATPSSGCAPLNNVDLTANVFGNFYSDNITYLFDCTNNGDWERRVVANSNSFTAYDLCNYYSSGLYTARVRVERQGNFSENTTQINVSNCQTNYNAPTVDLDANGSEGPITIAYNTSANLTWNSTNANYCQAYNGWSGSKNTSGSESTGNLTSSRIFTLTCTGQGGTVSDSVTVNVTNILSVLAVNKLVKNLSNGTAYLDSVSAGPNDVVSFSIQITAGNSYLQNIIVKDTLPDKIKFRGNLKIDGATLAGDITQGINIGSISAGQTRTITFDADVLGANQFAFGNTELINTVLVYNTIASVLDTAKITVAKAAVAGAATGIPTGFTNNILFDSFIIPLLITLVLIWIFKSRILKVEEYLDSRKRAYQKYKSDKTLQLKIGKVKAQEFLKNLQKKVF
ncbi:MAG: PKD domain-containing protein [Candidatus Pacebacteria bacterium]|nr:PKD domain-containing protein [Candidatus Paceibacterota bacterium]